jgi:hypothetical protein
MTEMNFHSELVDREVDRLFRESPPVYNEICRNPVTGGTYVGGLNPTRVQKRLARGALLAREWFASNGPADAQPLPLGDDCELHKAGNVLEYVVILYARSLACRMYNMEEHPPFADYVSGILWEAALPHEGFGHLPNWPVHELLELKKRFPPRKLPGMSPGAVWLPPKAHAKAIAECRRKSTNPDHHFIRE